MQKFIDNYIATESEITAYNATYPPHYTPIHIELDALRRAHNNAHSKNQETGFTSLYHFVNCYELLFPQFIPTLHYWSITRWQSLLNHEHPLVWAGAKSCGKSWEVGSFIAIKALSDPYNQLFIVSTTNLEEIELRAWGYVVKFMSAAKRALKQHPELYPFKYHKGTRKYVTISQDDISTENDDDNEDDDNENTMQSGIRVRALPEGDSSKIKKKGIGGRGPLATYWFIDETQEVAQNPLVVMPNYEKLDKHGRHKNILVAIGNSKTIFDALGQLAEPWVNPDPSFHHIPGHNSWENLNKDMDPDNHTPSWTTVHGGKCYWFSGPRSPVINQPHREALQDTGIFSLLDLEDMKRKYGEESPDFYQMALGFWLHTNPQASFISYDEIKHYHAHTLPTLYNTQKQYTAGLDMSFSANGDKSVLTIGYTANTVHPHTQKIISAYILESQHELQIIQSTIPPITQVLTQAKQLMDQHTPPIPYKHLAIDATGNMSSSIPALAALIFPQHTQIYFADSRNAPSTLPIQINPHRIAKDHYYNFASELIIQIKDFLVNHQIYNLKQPIINQLTGRELKPTNSTKLQIESKDEYFQRQTKNHIKQASPDHLDSYALALFRARSLLHLLPSTQMKSVDHVPQAQRKRAYWSKATFTK